VVPARASHSVPAVAYGRRIGAARPAVRLTVLPEQVGLPLCAGRVNKMPEDFPQMLDRRAYAGLRFLSTLKSSIAEHRLLSASPLPF
jgi:hypothetical protein